VGVNVNDEKNRFYFSLCVRQAGVRVPNILEGNVSFLKNQFLASFYFYQILNLRS
jgi:hypothetical protein